jgi:hypothetical protein
MNKPYLPATISLLGAGFVHGKGPSRGIPYYTPDGLVTIVVHPSLLEVHIGLLNTQTQQWHFPFIGRVRSEMHLWELVTEYVPLALLPTRCKERLVRLSIIPEFLALKPGDLVELNGQPGVVVGEDAPEGHVVVWFGGLLTGTSTPRLYTVPLDYLVLGQAPTSPPL